jgi:DNA replication terminus site-binding protein
MATIQEQLKDKMKEIEAVIDMIKPFIHQAKFLYWELYRLPAIDKKSENIKPDNIECYVDVSESAKFSLIKGLFNFYVDIELSTKAAQRTPGYFHLDMTDQEFEQLNSCLETINKLKSEFKDIISSVKRNDDKFEIVHSTFPCLMTLSVYRQIRIFKDPKKVSFFWGNKPLINKCDNEALITKLENSIKRKPGDKVWEKKVKHEITLVKSYKEEDNLRFMRITKAQPLVRVNNKNYSAPSPIIIVTVQNKSLFVEPLKSYDHALQKSGTGRKPRQYKEIIKRLSLFEVSD